MLLKMIAIMLTVTLTSGIWTGMHPGFDGFGPVTDEEVVAETTDPRTLTPGILYEAKGEELFTFKPAEKTHNTIQGGYFDGTHFYVAEIKRATPETVRIHVMDKNGATLRYSDPLPLDHANNLTYNSRLDRLVVTHCQSEDGHYYRYSMVDPETFAITETGDKPAPFFAMAYSPERDMYASGEWGGGRLDVWDGSMELLYGVDVEGPSSLSQGVFCDGDYMYFVRSSQNGHSSEVRIYNWDCELIHAIPLSLGGSIEPENINIVDGVTYVIGNDWSRGCGVAYKVTFCADIDPETGLDRRAPLPVEDPEMERMIRDTLQKPKGTLTLGDALGITALESFLNYNVKDLSAVSYMRNLEKLVIIGAGVSDLSPLCGLTSLKEIWLRGAQISDLSPLRDVPALEILYVDDNPISDLSPLTQLTSLTELSVGSTAITDITPLASLTGLRVLYIENTGVTDISPIANLTSLTDFSAYKIDLSGQMDVFSNMKAMKNLFLVECGISDLTPLATLRSLEYIHVDDNPISDLTPIVGLRGLKILHVANTNITDITPLSKMRMLTDLNLTGCRYVTDLTPIADLSALYYLSLDYTPVSDLKPLSNLNKLSMLLLRNTNVVDVTPLSHLNSLSYLALTNNKITDVSPLIPLISNLGALELDGNPVCKDANVDWTPFQRIPSFSKD